MPSRDDARRGRDRGMGRVESVADPDWLDAADEAIYQTALAYPELHCDLVWAYTGLGREPGGHDRAFGPRMQAAVRAGVLEPTEKFRPSVRSHLSGKPVWKSRVYVEDAGCLPTTR